VNPLTMSNVERRTGREGFPPTGGIMRSSCLALSLLVSLAVLGSGCSKMAEKIEQGAVEKAVEVQSGGKAKVDLSNDQGSITVNDGKTEAAWGQSVRVPVDFPKQIPIYPGSTVVSAVSDNTAKAKHMVMLRTADVADKVVDYYKGELKGFKVEQDANLGGYHIVKFAGGKQTALNVAMTFMSEQPPSSTTIVTIQTEAL
jgi:hypothetical protein